MNRTSEPGAFQNVLAIPDDGSFEAAVDAHELQLTTAQNVSDAVQASEKADPNLRLRIAAEARLRKIRPL